jgi:CRISPR-associated protein Csx10
MKIKLTTKSYLLCGSGEGAAMIDADVVFDEHGFPFIPSKRIKGLLRESATEVMEICGKDLRHSITSLFGSRNQKGLLQLSNLYPEHYRDSVQFVSSVEDDKVKKLLSPAKIKRHFTTERQQTTLTNDGVAKKFSLRNYRVIKPGLTFETTISVDETSLSSHSLALLQLSLINLKHIGTRRNRGFGLVNIEIEEEISLPFVGKMLTALEKSGEADEQVKVNDDQPKNEQAGDDRLNEASKTNVILPFIIKTLSPVVIAKQRGEQNTVSSEDYFPAPAVRGMLAQKLISHLPQNQKAHEDILFNEIFLSGNTLIKDAYPFEDNIAYKPAPLAYQAVKGGAKNQLYNILKDIPRDKDGRKQITRPAGGWITTDQHNYFKLEPRKSFYFHNVRYDNRLAGKSKEGGGIFYYESLNAGQVYKGHLYGDKNYLQSLRNKLGDSFKARIGRSKNTQYGEVEFNFDDNVNPPTRVSLDTEEIYLFFTSPVILLNEVGFPEPSKRSLERYLTAFFEEKIQIKQIITTARQALARGTTIKIRFLNFDANKNKLTQKLDELVHSGIGERTNGGFGNVKLMQIPYEINVKPAPTGVTNNNDITTVIKDILKSSYQDEFGKILKLHAMKKADRYQYTLSNHLVGRLEEMVRKAENVDDWEKQYMNHLESKHAGQRLKDVQLWDDLYKNFKKPVPNAAGELKDTHNSINKIADAESITAIDQFTKAQLYWSCFFKTLRKLNNQ